MGKYFGLLLITISFAYASAIELPRELLKANSQLTYSSNGELLLPWTVKTIRLDQNHFGMEHCTHSVIEYATDEVETNWECISNGLLHVLKDTDWIASRPVKKNMRLQVGLSVFETLDESTVELNGAQYKVLKTIVTNYHAEGSIRNRLTENFALSIGTATDGVFEVPDRNSPNGWRTVNNFKLISIDH